MRLTDQDARDIFLCLGVNKSTEHITKTGRTAPRPYERLGVPFRAVAPSALLTCAAGIQFRAVNEFHGPITRMGTAVLLCFAVFAWARYFGDERDELAWLPALASDINMQYGVCALLGQILRRFHVQCQH